MKPKRGFMEYVRNPTLFWKETKNRSESDGVVTDKEIADAVKKMAKRELAHEVIVRLKSAGEQVVPFLLDAFRNPKFQTRLYGKSIYDGTPLETALKLLEPFALPPAELLGPALNDRNEGIRSIVLKHLGRCGNEDAIPILRQGMVSGSEKIRDASLTGLQHLNNSGRVSARFRQEMFDAALPLLRDKDSDPARQAPYSLLELDRERAIGVLVNEEILSPDYEYVLDVLTALEMENVTVPASMMRNLLAAIKSRAFEFPYESIFARGMNMLARSEGPGVTDLIEDAKTWGNERVRVAAAESSVILAGVSDAYDVVIERYRTAGVKGLSIPQLHYLSLFWLDVEVCNGGFAQFFFNSSGELAIYVVDAARAIGANGVAAIVAKAIALFGPVGPETDHEARMEQLSSIDHDALSKLDNEYYDCPESVRELLCYYLVKHANEFRVPSDS